MIAFFLRLLAVAALTLMPAGMTAGAVPVDHPSMAGMAGPCEGQGDGEDGTSRTAMDCAGCAAVAADAPDDGLADNPKLPSLAARPTKVPGSGPELATPPPKRA